MMPILRTLLRSVSTSCATVAHFLSGSSRDSASTSSVDTRCATTSGSAQKPCLPRPYGERPRGASRRPRDRLMRQGFHSLTVRSWISHAATGRNPPTNGSPKPFDGRVSPQPEPGRWLHLPGGSEPPATGERYRWRALTRWRDRRRFFPLRHPTRHTRSILLWTSCHPPKPG